MAIKKSAQEEAFLANVEKDLQKYVRDNLLKSLTNYYPKDFRIGYDNISVRGDDGIKHGGFRLIFEEKGDKTKRIAETYYTKKSREINLESWITHMHTKGRDIYVGVRATLNYSNRSRIFNKDYCIGENKEGFGYTGYTRRKLDQVQKELFTWITENFEV